MTISSALLQTKSVYFFLNERNKRKDKAPNARKVSDAKKKKKFAKKHVLHPNNVEFQIPVKL